MHTLIKHCIWQMLSICLLWHWQVQLQMSLKFKRCHSDLQITLSAFEDWYQEKRAYFIWSRHLTYSGTFISLAWQSCVSHNGHLDIFCLQNPASIYWVSRNHQNGRQARNTMAMPSFVFLVLILSHSISLFYWHTRTQQW